MRKAVRLAAPAAIAAAALILTGCGSDSDSKDNDAQGNDSQQESTGGGDSETDADADAGDDTPAGDSPSAEELIGWWSSGLTEESNTIIFAEGEVTAMLNLSAEAGDICGGTYTDGALALSCTLGSDFESATLSLNDDTLDVAWSNGSTETYTKVPGMEDIDLGELGDAGGFELDF